MPLTQADREKIASQQQLLAKETAAIRADKTLSAEGKRLAIAKKTAWAQDQINAVRERVAAADSEARTRLRRSLFGLPPNASPSDVISFRDAQDRAARLNKPSAALHAWPVRGLARPTCQPTSRTSRSAPRWVRRSTPG